MEDCRTFACCLKGLPDVLAVTDVVLFLMLLCGSHMRIDRYLAQRFGLCGGLPCRCKASSESIVIL